MKKYIITTGSYEDYRIINIIQGPDSPALSTLYKDFTKEFDVPEYPKSYSWSTFEVYFNSCEKATKRLQEEGYLAEESIMEDIPAAFINWLVKHHGYQIDKSVKKFHIV